MIFVEPRREVNAASPRTTGGVPDASGSGPQSPIGACRRDSLRFMAELADLTVDELTENFELLGEWEERYRYLIDLGRKLPSMPPEYQTEENRVHGCQATVWLKALPRPAVSPGAHAAIEIFADADAHIVKGLIAILLILYSGRSPDEILSLDPKPLFSRLGFDRFLSPTRHNGLFAMVERIRAIARTIESS
jgi:cysteine desulfuration protein SufE